MEQDITLSLEKRCGKTKLKTYILLKYGETQGFLIAYCITLIYSTNTIKTNN